MAFEAVAPAVALSFAPPQRGASLMLAFRMHSKLTLVIGSNRLAASRCLSALEADSRVVVLARGGVADACEELRWRAQQKELDVLDFSDLAGPSDTSKESDVESFEAFLDSHGPIALVCVTDTMSGASRRSRTSATQIYNACRQRNIPVNVTDMPELCDFTFSSTHRFADPHTGNPTPLQVAVTTNGQGCRLAGRIRRDMVAAIPPEAGVAVQKMGRLRDLAKASNKTINEDVEADETELNEEMTVLTPNRPVQQRSTSETHAERARRRMKWVSQISEYSPISRIATLTDEEMNGILSDELAVPALSESVSDSKQSGKPTSQNTSSLHSLTLSPKPLQGRILLVGSGPGHPSLLTMATHAALTKHADLVLTDKLVPSAVLALIPKHVEVRVARKFPGNAEGAQMEMMEAAVEAARAGKTVVRLKQGDPMLYGRAGEEILYFRRHGFEAIVIPGVSAALAAPLLANIPVTQRGVSESLVVCTGVGRKGRDVRLPGYERSRTLVVLMGVARLPQMLEALMEPEKSGGKERERRRSGAAYPPYTPIALIERASMPDQRVVASTLQHITTAIESTGEQRPPGSLVVGWAVLALWGEGDVTVLDGDESGTCPSAEDDVRRVERWLDGRSWRVKDGLDSSWDMFKEPVPSSRG